MSAYQYMLQVKPGLSWSDLRGVLKGTVKNTNKRFCIVACAVCAACWVANSLETLDPMANAYRTP